MAETILFIAKMAGQYTPFLEFVASTANHASEAISDAADGPRGSKKGRRLASESCAVGGEVVGGFHSHKRSVRRAEQGWAALDIKMGILCSM